MQHPWNGVRRILSRGGIAWHEACAACGSCGCPMSVRLMLVSQCWHEYLFLFVLAWGK